MTEKELAFLRDFVLTRVRDSNIRYDGTVYFGILMTLNKEYNIDSAEAEAVFKKLVQDDLIDDAFDSRKYAITPEGRALLIHGGYTKQLQDRLDAEQARRDEQKYNVKRDQILSRLGRDLNRATWWVAIATTSLVLVEILKGHNLLHRIWHFFFR